MISYVLTQGNQATLIYIADSMGAAMFSIAMIKHPKLNAKIERMGIINANTYLLICYTII